MTVYQAYQTAIRMARRQWKLTTVVYFVQLALVLLLSLQVFQVLEASIGKSLQVNVLRDGYHHTVITDFLKVHGASITPLLGQLRWVLLIWLLISAFLQSGLLHAALTQSGNRVDSFFSACGKFFFPTLAIGACFMLGAIMSGAFVLGPVLVNFQSMIDKYDSEKAFLLWLAGALAFWFLILFVLYSWSILSRLAYMQGERGIFSAIGAGWKALRKRFFTYLIIAIIAASILILFWMLFQWFAGPGAYQSTWTLFLISLLSQAIIWLRIWLRQLVFGAYVGVGS